jgi:hypothetical protein
MWNRFSIAADAAWFGKEGVGAWGCVIGRPLPLYENVSMYYSTLTDGVLKRYLRRHSRSLAREITR